MKNQNLLTVIVFILAASFALNLFDIITIVYKGYFDVLLIVQYIPLLIGITGLVLLTTSKFIKSNLIMYYMGISVFTYPFGMLMFFKYALKEPDLYGPRFEMDALLYLRIGFGFLVFIASCVGIWILSKKKTAQLSYNVIGNETFPEFKPASPGKRFLNRLIDTVTYVFIALTFIRNGLFGEAIKEIDSTLEYTIIEIPFIIVYYLFFESLFHATPGKFITNSIVVNDSGERPNFTQILGRTFSRLIPFDALTFFGDPSRGWHDSLPNTYVVEAIDADAQRAADILLDVETAHQL